MPEPTPATDAVREIELTHFEEACELLRHHSGLRLRQLAIFVAINGGLLFGLYRLGSAIPETQLYGFVGLGLIAALAFIILEIRLNTYLDHYRAIVTAYEERFALPHRLHDPNLRGFVFRGRIAVLLFIFSVIGVWAIVALMAQMMPGTTLAAP